MTSLPPPTYLPTYLPPTYLIHQRLHLQAQALVLLLSAAAAVAATVVQRKEVAAWPCSSSAAAVAARRAVDTVAVAAAVAVVASAGNTFDHPVAVYTFATSADIVADPPDDSLGQATSAGNHVESLATSFLPACAALRAHVVSALTFFSQLGLQQ